MIFATDPAEVFTNEPHVPKAYRFMGELMRKYGNRRGDENIGRVAERTERL